MTHVEKMFLNFLLINWRIFALFAFKNHIIKQRIQLFEK